MFGNDSFITKTIMFGGKNNDESVVLKKKLNLFLKEMGQDDAAYFSGQETGGEGALFYSQKGDLLGCIRILREVVRVCERAYTVSTLRLHLDAGDPALQRLAANFYFLQSLKYKLSHPNEELVHISLKNDPQCYHFFNQLCSQIYPNPQTDIPERLLKLVQELKILHNWKSSAFHPMIIELGAPPEAGHRLEKARDGSDEFYQSFNPNYRSGDALLTCMPLSLVNLSHAIKQLLRKQDYWNAAVMAEAF